MATRLRCEHRRAVYGEGGNGDGQPPAHLTPREVRPAELAVVASSNGGGTDVTPQLLTGPASLIRRMGGVRGLRRLLDAVEAGGRGG
jgi:hypothetical protein